MKKIIDCIQTETGLQYDQTDGQMLIKIRPSRSANRAGWEVLVRLTPRPLSARPWRVCSIPGALNATIAAAMLRLLSPNDNESLLNLMCGSGSILIEAACNHQLRQLLGCDINPAMLLAARKNSIAAKLTKPISLLQCDVNRLPLLRNSFDLICADLPWGERIGQRDNNIELYSQTLEVIDQHISRNGKICLLTQDIKALTVALNNLKNSWIVSKQLRVFQGGFHPHIFVCHPPTRTATA